MKYDLLKAIEILERTPEVLYAQLNGLSDVWLHANEGPDTWSPFQVVGHLIINEQTNFLTRIRLIVSSEEPIMLAPVNMIAHLERFKVQTIANLLSEFASLRGQNLEDLKMLVKPGVDLQKVALHPKLGNVRLVNILATWVAHDLTHLGQITRVMARQFKEVGPFIEFLTRLK